MKTQEEIQKEIEALKAILPKVRHWTKFGDDNIGAVEAQIMVLENDWDFNEIYERFDCAEHILSAALQARDWVEDSEAYNEGLSVEWPLISEV